MPRDYNDGSVGANPLIYQQARTSDQKPRWRGRIELRPEVDLSQYEFKSVIDWIELRFDTPARRQAVKIYNRILTKMGVKTRITGPNGEEYFTGTSFVLRIQDPEPNNFYKICDFLIENYAATGPGGSEGLQISGIEVAIDIYPANRSKRVRMSMSAAVRRHLVVGTEFLDEPLRQPHAVFTEPFEEDYSHVHLRAEPRQRHKKKAEDWEKWGVTPELVRDLSFGSYKQMPFDGTHYVGEQHGDRLIRLQDKVTDCRDPEKGTVVALPADQHRTRVEVTLTGEWVHECGVATHLDLKRATFRKLSQRYFKFAFPTLHGGRGPRAVIERETFRKGGLPALTCLQRAWHYWEQLKEIETGSRVRRPQLLEGKHYGLAWSELNRRGARALMRLEERWQR